MTDLTKVQFHAGQRRLSAGALNAMVDGILDLRRAGNMPDAGNTLMAIRAQEQIAVGSKGLVKRCYWTDETSSDPATITDNGDSFYAANLGPSQIETGELATCYNTAGIFPVFCHTEPPGVGAADVNLYLSGSASADIANYKLADVSPVATEATISATITGANQVIEEWVSAAGVPNISQLQAGAVDIHVHAAKTSGTKAVTIKGLIYKRDTGGSETLLGTSAASAALQNVIAFCDLYATVSETAFAATDRLVLKITATPTGSGTNPVVALYIGGQYGSLFECSALSQDTGTAASVGNPTSIISAQTVTNGTALTAMRTDGAPGLKLAASPADTGTALANPTLEFCSTAGGLQVKIGAEYVGADVCPTLEATAGAGGGTSGLQVKLTATSGLERAATGLQLSGTIYKSMVPDADNTLAIGSDALRFSVLTCRGINVWRETTSGGPTVELYADTVGLYPRYSVRRYRGSHASPTAVTDTAVLGVYQWEGWDGTDVEEGARIYAVATENWVHATEDHGTKMVFATTSIGADGVTDRMTLDENGLSLAGALIGGISTMTAEAAVADADVFPFYDNTASANRKVTAANLKAYCALAPASTSLSTSAAFASAATIVTRAAGSAKVVCGKVVGNVSSGGSDAYFVVGLYADSTLLAVAVGPTTGVSEATFEPVAIPSSTTNVLIKVLNTDGVQAYGDNVYSAPMTYITVF